MNGVTKTERPKRLDQRQLPDVIESSGYSRVDQIKSISLSVVAGAILAVARILQPSSRGVGTHEQLGLPPCPFLYYTGIPCPSCGLTTSFAYAARFNFSAALMTQPFGLIAFCLTVLSIPLSIYLMCRRRSWSELIHSRNLDALIYALIGIYSLSWIYKIIAMKWHFGGN